MYSLQQRASVHKFGPQLHHKTPWDFTAASTYVAFCAPFSLSIPLMHSPSLMTFDDDSLLLAYPVIQLYIMYDS